MIELKELTLEDLKKFWDFYRGSGYEVFFRHFPKGLDIKEFEVLCMVMGGPIKAVDKDSGLTSGYAITRCIPDVKHCEVSVLVPKKIQKRGLGLEIIKELGELVFGKLAYNRLICITVEDDERTNSLLTLGNLTKEGVSQESAKVLDKLCNEVRWSLTSYDYLKLYKRQGNQ